MSIHILRHRNPPRAPNGSYLKSGQFDVVTSDRPSLLWSGPQIDAIVPANYRQSGTEAIGRALRYKTDQETVRRTRLWGRPRYLQGTEFLIDPIRHF